MQALRDKLEEAFDDGTLVDDILEIVEKHSLAIKWSSPSTCRFAHVFSDCGAYEIDSRYDVYYLDNLIAARHNLEDAKQAAQTHKEGRG